MSNNLWQQAYGSNFDVKLSYEDYLNMVDCLHDNRLTRDGMFKLKCLAEVNQVGIPAMALYMLPFGILAAKLVTGRSQSGYRYFFTVLSITYPLSCWYGYTRPIPRRLYTEILCDQGEDGSYVRILHQKPGLWRKLSGQLHGLGYQFPEIIENSNNKTNFPLDFVKNN